MGEQLPKKDARSIRARLGRLRELYIDGDIERAAYEERSAALKRELEEAETPDFSLPRSVSLPSEPRYVYGLLPEKARKLFWKRVLRSIEIRNGRPALVFFL